MKISAQTVTWFIFLALIKNYSCVKFKLLHSTLTATEESCIEIKCKVPDPDDLDRGYWFWMKNAVWNTNSSDFDGTIAYSSDKSKRTVDPIFASRVTKTPDENPSSPQCSILICGLDKSDSGNYSVRYIRDRVGSEDKWKTQEVNLTVTENPCPVTFEKPPVVRESETITLTCSTLSSCSSNLLIQGKGFNSSPVKRQEGEKKTATVHFQASWKDEGKTFSCQTQNNSDKYLIKEETVTVEYTPKETTAEISPTDIREGQSVTFTCSANGNPEPDITWFFNNDHKQAWSKQIESIQRSQSGQYHCMAQNKHGSLNSSKVTVDVQYVPQVEVKTDSCNSPRCVLKEKDRITLTCNVIDANPKPNAFFWYKNERRLSSGTQYEKVIHPEDSGRYTCDAENTVDTGKSKALNLEVQYAPRGTSISAGENVKIGQRMVLTCETDARPAPSSYTWNRNNDKQQPASSSSKTLTLQSAQREDEGCYTCTAKNQISTGPRSKPKCIRVLYPPTNLLLSMETEAREGQLLTISCSVESNPQSHLTVKMPKEDRPFPGRTDPQFSSQTPNNKLQFTINVTSAHTGAYSCYAWNTEGSKESQQKKLVVKYRPKDVRVQAVPGLDVIENASLTLSCKAQSHPPVTSFIWMKVNKGKDEPIWTKTQTITVKSVSPSDSGLYQCVASNEMGTRSSQQVEVKVKYAPKHTNITNTQTVSRTSQQQPDGKTSVTLSCSSHSYPPPTYQWYKKTDEEDREVSKDQNLTVYSDQPGVYFCIAKNEVNHRSSDPVELFVDNFPKALKLLIPCLLILLIIVLVFFALRRKRSKSLQQGTENTPPRSGFLCWRNYARRRSLMNVPCMSEPSQSRDDLLPDQPCRPNPQHHQARPDSTPESNIASVYATVNLPAGKQAPSAPKPARQRAGNTEDESINYASLHFAKRPKDVKELDAVYAMVSKKKPLKTNEEEIQRMHDYENVTAALEAKTLKPPSSETSSTSSTSSDSSDNEVELNYSQVSFKAKPGLRRPAIDSSTSEDEEVTQYSQVKI